MGGDRRHEGEEGVRLDVCLQAVCEVCGNPLWWTGRGKRPTKCHGPDGDSKGCSRNLRRASVSRLVPVPFEASRTSGHQKRQRERKDAAQEMADRAASQFRHRAVAIALRIEKDPKKACALVGVPPGEIAETIKRAQAPELKSLREGHASSLAGTVNVLTQLLAERLLVEHHTIPIGQVSNSLNALAKVADAMGGFERPYTTFTIKKKVKVK